MIMIKTMWPMFLRKSNISYMKKSFIACLVTTIIIGIALSLSACSASSTNYNDEEEPLDIYDYCIPANVALNHVGEEADVVGFVVSWSSPGIAGDPLFINLEADYPDEDRFQVVLWDDIRYEYYDDLGDRLLGKTVVVHGVIENYNGVAQITLDEDGFIEEEQDYLEHVE